VSGVPELLDTGVRAYLAGRVKEALAAFQQVLAIDPGNAKARGYIVRIHAVTPATTPVPGTVRTLSSPGSLRRTPVPRGPPPVAPPAPPRAPERPAGPSRSAWDEDLPALASIVVDAGRGLDLAAIADPAHGTAPPDGPADPVAWMTAARERQARGDVAGAIALVERVLAADPAHAGARELLARLAAPGSGRP
jgi:tetratricopeptide (TPR) repeat protein